MGWGVFATALLITTLIVVPSAPTRAAEPQAETKEPAFEALELMKEEETVSIAVRHEQPISQAPSEVYVITDEDIRQSGAIDLPTILRRIPGMEVMQVTGAQFNVSVRGDNQLQANKLLVMVDGRSIYIDATGQVFWKLLPVTLPEIKRIEVLKGPASAVWGFNAFDGIVNIITKSPEDMRGTTLQFGGGEFGTIMASAVQAGTIDKFSYRLSIGWNQNQEWRNRDALAFRDYLFNVQTEYALSGQSKVKLLGGLVDSNRFDGGVTQDTFDSTRPSQGYAHVTYERPNFLISGFWTRNDISVAHQSFNPVIAPFLQATDLSGNPAVNFLADTFNVDVQHTVVPLHGNLLTYGVNYRYNTVSCNIFSQFTHENRLGLYFNDEWRATSALRPIAGLRYDLDTFINPTVSPRAALLYTPVQDHTFRVSISVSYRPPTIAEKSINERVDTLPPLPPSTTFIQTSLPLSPEQIVSYDAGYQGWYFRHRLRARVNLFLNHISDLISSSINISPTVASPVNNGGSADIYGGEAGVELLATKWLTGFANYSYQEITQSITGRGQRAGPQSKFNIGLRGEWENGLSAEGVFNYYGPVTYPPGQSFTSLANAGLITLPNPRVGGYNLLNLRGAWRFWEQKAAAGYLREAELAVSAFNALDDRHKEHPLGDTIGSRWMGWLTVRF